MPMSTVKDSALLLLNAEAKKARLAETAQVKQQLLGPGEYLARPDAANPDNYESALDYEAAGNSVTPSIIQGYEDKLRQQRRGANALDRAAREAREAGALVKDAEMDTLGGELTQLGAGAAGGVNRMASHAATAPQDIRGTAVLEHVGDEARAIQGKQAQTEAARADLQRARTEVLTASFTSGLSREETQRRVAEIDAQLEGLPQLSAEENALLDSPLTSKDHRDITREGAAQIRGEDGEWRVMTNREALAQAGESFGKGQEIRERFDNSAVAKLLNPLNREQLSDDLKATYLENEEHFTKANQAFESGDYATMAASGLTGIAKLVAAGGKDIINNPAAAFEYIAENAPQLAVGGFSTKLLAATNVAYAGDIYGRAIEAYKAENDGALPTQAEAGEMLGWSMSAALAEQLGDANILGALKGASHAGRVSNAINSAVANAVKDGAKYTTLGVLAQGGGKALDVGLKVAQTAGKVVSAPAKLVPGGVARVAGESVRGAAGEAVTELYQTAVEENFSKLNRDFDGAALFEGAAVGAAAGGGLSGGLKAGRELLDSIGGMALKNVNARLDAGEADKAYSDAVTSGDVTALTDPSKPKTFAPDKAVGALMQRLQNPELTPEQKAATELELDRVVSTVDAQITGAQEQIDAATPEGIQALRDLSTAAAEQLAVLPEDAPLETREELTTQAEGFAQMADLIEQDGPEIIKLNQEKLEKLKKTKSLIDQRQQVQAQITESVTPDVEADMVTQTEAVEDSPERQAAASQALTLAMRNPQALSDDALGRLSVSPAFTPEEQVVFSTMSAARIAANALKKEGQVTSNILTGDAADFKGLNQYEADVATYLRKRNVKEAGAQVVQLAKFAKHHIAKQKAHERARGLVNKMTSTGVPVYLYQQPGSEDWAVTRTKPENWDELGTKFQTSKHAGHVAALDRMIETQALENAAIVATGAQLKAAVKLAQGKKPEAPKAEPKVEAAPVDPALVPGEELDITPVTALRGVTRIISGGQTGGDMGGLLAGQALGLQTGGTVPKGGRREGKPISPEEQQAYGLTEDASTSFPPRTMKNVDAAAATIAFSWGPSVGTGKTIGYAQTGKWQYPPAQAPAKPHRPVLVITSRDVTEAAQELRAFIEQHEPESLNIAGHRESSQPGLQQFVQDVLELALGEQELGPETVGQVTEEVSQETAYEEMLAEENAEPVTEPEAEPAVAEDALPTTEPEVITDGRPPGALTGVGDPANRVPGKVDNETHRSANLFQGRFYQVGEKEGSTSQNPLVMVRDFMSTLFAGNAIQLDVLQQYLDTKAVSAKQSQYVSLLAEYMGKPNGWASMLVEQITQQPEYLDSRYRDWVQYMRDNLDQNLLTGISLAAFTYVAENGAGTGLNNDDTIKAMLGMQSGDKLSPSDRMLFKSVGERESLVIAALGKRIRASLGLKAYKDAPISDVAQLEMSLGTQALALLLREGLVVRTQVDITHRASEAAKQRSGGQPIVSSFIQVSREANQNVVGKSAVEGVAAIVEAAKDTSSIMNKLFGIEPGVKFPPTEANQYKQDSIRNSDREVPSYLREILEKYSRREWKMRTDMRKVRTGFSPENQALMAGVVNLEQTVMHVALREAQEAKNQDIERGMGLLAEYDTEVGDGVFYMVPRVWKQQRAGLDHNGVDPQQDKYQRHNIAMKAWATEVDPRDAGAQNTVLFKLAVAQGLGIKTDKQSIQRSLDQLDAVRNSDAFDAAITALFELDALPETETLAPELQADVVALVQGMQFDLEPTDQSPAGSKVAAGGQNFHSLDALMNLMHFEKALAAGTTFTTDIMYEVDGVNNGPALAQIQLGTMSGNTGNMFGFYNDDSPYTGVASYLATPGNSDLYVTVSKAINAQQTRPNQGLDSLKALGLVKFDRPAVKTPTTALVFGSGMRTVVDDMALEVVDRFYEELTKAVVLEDMAHVRALIDGMNQLMPGKARLAYPKKLSDALELTLNPFQESMFKRGYKDLVGDDIEAALEEVFGDFLPRRTLLNEAAQAAFKAYDAAFNLLKEKRIQELLEANELPHSVVQGVKLPNADLTPDEIQKIRDILKPMEPIVHTAMSKLSGDLDSGLTMAKVEAFLAEDSDRPYTTNGKSGVPLPNTVTEKGKQTTVKTLNPRAVLDRPKDPGVAMVILLLHSLDSAIAATSYRDWATLNIHDALGAGIKGVLDAAKALNSNTFDLMGSYSLPMELSEALNRSFAGAEQVMQANPEIAAELKQALSKLEVGRGEAARPIDETFRSSVEGWATRMALDTQRSLRNTRTVDQYSMEGGSHEVTPEQRAQVEAKVGELEAKLEALAEEFNREGEKPAEATKSVDDSPWGPLGESQSGHDPALVAHLEKSGGSTVRQIKDLLAYRLKSIEGGAWKREFPSQLLTQLLTQLDPKTKIVLVTPETEMPAEFKDKDLRSARGWTYLSGDNRTIYIKSPAFRDSGVTPELLLHEMTHAAVAQVIDRADGDPAVAKIVAQLETIRQKAQELDTEGNFTEALVNVQELVAWGMTNVAFQTQILARIDMGAGAATATTTRVHRSGFKAFIDALTSLLFKNPTAALSNGLGALIANTALLMESSQKTPPSTPEQDSLTLLMENTDPRTFTAEQVYEGLGELGHTRVESPAQDNRLRQLLTRVVQVVYGGEGALKASAARQAPATAADVFLMAQVEGRVPYSSLAAAVLPLNDQEAYVLESVEAAAQAALLDASSSSQVAQRELKKLWAQAKKAITWESLVEGDLSQASDLQVEKARAMHAFLFQAQHNEKGSSDYLGRFLAVGLVYAPLHDRLQQLTLPLDGRYADKNLAQRLIQLYDNLMNRIARWMTGTYEGQTGGDALGTLAVRLANIEAKRKATLHRKQGTPENILNRSIGAASDKGRAAVVKVAESRMFKNSKNGFVRAAGSVTATVAGERTELFIDAFERLRNQVTEGRLGWAPELVNDMRTERDSNRWLRKLLGRANALERARKSAATDTGSLVLEGFDPAKPLTKEQRETLTTLLKTDLSVFSGARTMADIEALVRDDTRLNQAIRDLEKQLSKSPHALYYLSQAKDLAWYMTSGHVADKNVQMNAHNIAFLANTTQVGTVNTLEGRAAEAQLDQLISLYALSYTEMSTRQAVSEIMRHESNRKDGGNGVDAVLRLHKYFQAEAKKNLFEGSEFHVQKGYMKEILNPNVNMVSATAQEGAALLKAGYTLLSTKPMELDVNDLSREPKYLYTLRGAGLNTTASGAMSMTSRHQMGTRVHGDVNSAGRDTPNQFNKAKNDKMLAARQQGIDKLFARPASYDPRKQPNQHQLAPVLGPNGMAVNYRYLMSDDVKNRVMGRNNRIDHVLGAVAGSMLDKEKSPEINQAVVDGFKEQYDAEYLRDPSRFIEFSERSADPVIRERYRLLPDDTKRHIRETWGQHAMYVRNDLYGTAFGYRKYSIGDALTKDPAVQNAIEKIMVAVLVQIPIVDENGQTRYIPSARAQKIMQAEDAWQEIVKEIKDIWVIKNLWTFMGNEISNLITLAWFGVPLTDIVKGKTVAIKATLEYQKDHRDHYKLKKTVDAGVLTGDALVEAQSRLVELEDAMLRNPVKELVDEGMLQNLIEDVATEIDPYSYKTRLTEWVDAKTTRVPKGMKTAAKWMLMTHDTPIYKALNQATMLSDFTSRYTLHQHLISRKRNPMSREESFSVLRDAFVNYDIPMQKGVQYLDDMGVLWFSRYGLRIQKVIFQLWKDNPANALGIMLLSNLLPGLTNIQDSSFLTSMPGNFGAGPLEIVNAWDEPIPIQAALNLTGLR